jgi:hypothetical protein
LVVDKASSNWSSVLIALDSSELRTVASSSDCDRGDTQGNEARVEQNRARGGQPASNTAETKAEAQAAGGNRGMSSPASTT